MFDVKSLKQKLMELGDKIQELHNANDKNTNVMSPYKRRMHKKLVKENREKIDGFVKEIDAIKTKISIMEKAEKERELKVSSYPFLYNKWSRGNSRFRLFIT